MMDDDLIIYCPVCGAILTTQDGFDADLAWWKCTECGELLYGDIYEGEKYPNVMWFCDKCGDLLNTQDGFTDLKENWNCSKCGYNNSIKFDRRNEPRQRYN